jgi:hypothetical protein
MKMNRIWKIHSDDFWLSRPPRNPFEPIRGFPDKFSGEFCNKEQLRSHSIDHEWAPSSTTEPSLAR